MMTTQACPGCGRPPAGDEPQGLCPYCLLQGAAMGETHGIVPRSCGGCGNTLDDEARFCARCGTAAAAPQTPDDPLRQALEAKLAGQYRLLRLLGRGGMGAVYLARDLALEREVAIKVVTPASNTPGLYERFRREAKTAAGLSHPNIVPLHAFGEVEGMPYFVMGYVRGESLADRLRRDGKLDEGETRRILAEIADALDHAHRQGVVHRDVKPDNVLLEDASGRALLTDFGIAKTLRESESLTHQGSVVGTPHYMSPEQAAGRADIDGRSDIYSLGVMGFVMLSGRLPFDGDSAAAILSKHLSQEPPSLRSLVPAASDSMRESIERSMAKDPARRWQDGRALKAALGSSEEAALPDSLESVQGHGLPFVLIAATLLLLLWMVVVRMQGAPPSVLALIGGVMLAGYVGIVAGLRHEGFPIGVAQRVIWSEPSWWPYWYPRSLRRRGNVWERLPSSVKLLRCYSPFVFISVAIFAVNASEYFIAKAVFFFVVFVITVVLELRVKMEMKRKGILSSNDRNRIAFSSPPSRVSFWAQPRIAAILAPAPKHETRRAGAGSPHDQLQSILHDAEELSGPLRSLGAEAASAARRLIASIEQYDRQIAELARNLEPGEERRLSEKIDALADSAEAAPMRELLEKQLELLRGLSARLEEAKDARNRHIEMLKTLALHVTSLRARLAATPSEVRSLSDNVRSLCDHISQQGGPPADDVPTMQHPGAVR